MIYNFMDMPAEKYYDNKKECEKRNDMLNNKNNQYIATVKNDGEWACFIYNADKTLVVRSRSISKVTNKYGDFTAKVPHLVEEFKKIFKPGTVVLGELCFDDPAKTSKDVGTILRCLPDKAVERQKTNPLSLKCFDILEDADSGNLLKTPYINRLTLLTTKLASSTSAYISCTQIFLSNFIENAEEIWSKGGEGLVIQRKNNEYEPGKRTAWHTLKLKKTLGEVEVPIIGIQAPTYEYTGDSPDTWKFKDENGKNITKFAYYNWAGAILVDYKGTRVSISSGLNDEDRAYLNSDEGLEAIRKQNLIAVINAMEEDPVSGSLRHPIVVRIRQKENM